MTDGDRPITVAVDIGYGIQHVTCADLSQARESGYVVCHDPRGFDPADADSAPIDGRERLLVDRSAVVTIEGPADDVAVLTDDAAPSLFGDEDGDADDECPECGGDLVHQLGGVQECLSCGYSIDR